MVSRSVARVPPERRAVGVLGCGDVPEVLESNAESVVRMRHAWINRKRLLKSGHGLLIPICPHEQQTAIDVRRRFASAQAAVLELPSAAAGTKCISAGHRSSNECCRLG